LVNGFALGEHDALTVLREWNGSCQPTWSESALVHKIKSAAAASHQFPRGYLLGDAPTGASAAKPIALPPKPKFKPEALKRIAGKTSEIKDVVRFIAERSPVRVDTQNSASVLRRLYARG